MTSKNPSDWIGKEKTCSDLLSVQHTKKIASALGELPPDEGDALPPLWQWAFFNEPVDLSELGADGHPARGSFLPPAEGRNRMWAGGSVEWFKPLRLGRHATCRTSINDVEEKRGRTGQLLFVTLQHEYIQGNEVCVREEQDIVYRAPSPPKMNSDYSVPEPQWQEAVEPSSVMLFRYSAVTFNGHRIHYDHPYATEVEGYSGLVVHGPLQATLMLQAFCKVHPTRIPRYYRYRGLRPLTANQTFQGAGADIGATTSQLWTFTAEGPAHIADLEFEELK